MNIHHCRTANIVRISGLICPGVALLLFSGAIIPRARAIEPPLPAEAPGVPAAKASPSLAPPPVAALLPVTDEYHGPDGAVSVIDNYRWLESADDPAVKAWCDAQNARTRAYFTSIPPPARVPAPKQARPPATAGGRKPVPQVLFPETQRPNGLFVRGLALGKPQSFLALLPSATAPDSAKIIFDLNTVDPSGLTEIVFSVPSQSGKYIGIAEARDGTEDGTLHVYETATGRELPDKIARVYYPTGGGSIAWSADDSGFYYTRYPQPGERTGADEYNFQQVYYHRLGTPVANDTYALGKDFPSIAETTLLTSRDGKYTVADVRNGDGGEHSFYLRQPAGIWGKIAANADGLVDARFGGDDALYLLSRKVGAKSAPDGCVLRLPAGASALSQARVIVPEGKTAIEEITPTHGKLYVFYIDGGPSAIKSFDLDGTHSREVPLPPLSAASSPVWTNGDTLLYSVESYTTKKAVMQYAPDQTSSVRSPLVPVFGPGFGDIITRREFAVSKDGTRVPMTILMKQGTSLDGSHPTIITGYGGYGISESPQLDYSSVLWCRAGGVYAFTNIRGGGEYGDAWHRAGSLVNKQNVFDDFAACARHLIDQGYTRPEKLGAMGASNGGLLMGAEITQHPELFKCVVALSGWYDGLRFELSPNGPTNTTEFGSVRNPAQFAALYAYSPYHNIKDGVKYPDVLMLTGDNDGRVDPMNSRKMIARLQAAAAPGSVLLLRTSATSGHMVGGSSADAKLQWDNIEAFFYHELGLPQKPPAVAAPK